MATWPLQADCKAFYGDPTGTNGKASPKWQSANLVTIKPPWTLRYEGKAVRGIRVHKKCAESLARVLQAIWERVGQSQDEIDRIGMSVFGGSFNYRPKRGGSSLSMHAYGCAVDFDPDRNGFGDPTPEMDRRVIEEFEREGWEWGGHWSKPDGMHFQAARTRASPPRLSPAPVGRPVASTSTLGADEIRAIQQALRNLGYSEVGFVDGIWGSRTTGALAAFQAQEGLPTTGQPDSATRLRLISATPRPVSAEREALTAQDLRSASPPVAYAHDAKTWAGLAAFFSFLMTVLNGIIDFFGEAATKIAPMREFLSDVPPAVWFAAASGIAYATWRNSAKAEKASVDQIRSGETAGPV
ncbi:M15 family metallopeptidase [Hyphomicrobium sulfonivorans]|uniref:M15 family metallopeptidase n=1 Tax=Hyphomicrobium sulfonivorans TaxID=121290 RepID=UPI00156DDDD8|nr:M15 family metallopeptidase [Hyphomicrobium sulfonivorans]MBI1649891.1 M15 family metallopeptidase [Hyphomicrobium sulfonivorans]NSL71802.1 hypothetical protein [Hyphomicrobium sulfonivorans]